MEINTLMKEKCRAMWGFLSKFLPTKLECSEAPIYSLYNNVRWYGVCAPVQILRNCHVIMFACVVYAFILPGFAQ